MPLERNGELVEHSARVLDVRLVDGRAVAVGDRRLGIVARITPTVIHSHNRVEPSQLALIIYLTY